MDRDRAASTAPETLNVKRYVDAASYARERAAIFARSWLFIGHESQFSATGSVVATTIAGFPLLVVRDDKGQLRAYHNVCRHRAGPLAPDGESQCSARLTCRYHGWSYALDGRLASARDFGPALAFNPRDYSLYPLRCDSWNGFVFVNLDTGARALSDEVAPLGEKIGAPRPNDLRVVHRASHPIRCNWKTYVENYLEGYHVPLIHPALNASGDFALYDVEIEPPAIFHRVPTKNDAAVAGVWAWLWPSLAINLYADGVLMERITPLSHDRMTLDYLFLAPRDATDKDIQRSIDASLVTTKEDIDICEAVQRNLEAGIYKVGRLSPKHEKGVAWFQEEVRRRCSDPAGFA